MASPPPFADLHLAKRLERDAGPPRSLLRRGVARFRRHIRHVRRRRLASYADLWTFDEITDSVLNDIEAFFRDRGAQVFHEVCPLSAAALAQRLCSRGYRPVELSNVLYRPLDQLPDVGDLQVATRRTREDERDLWVQTTALGWSGIPEAADYLRQAGPVMADRGFVDGRTRQPELADADSRLGECPRAGTSPMFNRLPGAMLTAGHFAPMGDGP